MNRSIRRLGIGILVLYLALFVKLNWIQVVDKEALDDNPLNTAQVRRDFNRPRGAITSGDDVVLAQSVPNPDESSEFERLRVYPEGELFAQSTGFFSFRYGSTGLEREYSDLLAGTTFDQQVRGLGDLLVARENVGNVEISLRKDVQEVARAELRDREGSVVAVNPQTGELLAFWSFPSYDPNAVSTTDQVAAEQAWSLYNLDASQPMRAHQYQDRYFPGSTFKVVTGSVGLQTGKVTNEDPVYKTATSYTPPQTTRAISNFGGRACGGALPEVLRVSCNSAFAEMGQATIGPTDMVNGSESWGFNAAPPIDLPDPARSVFPTDVQNNPPKLAQSSIGQNDVQATPLQMALVAAGVANRGTIMTPHLMTEVRDSQGEVIKEYDQKAWLNPMSPELADVMRGDMINVAERGTATGLRIPGFEVGGKTGTAQLGTDPPRSHTWIIGFAGPPGQASTVAIAVVVLNQSGASEATGGAIAAPIARAVMQKILAVQAGG
ncbi:MAG TPA: penicillin-binding transpeptidase domain-containing protein [Acidimicrobiales bacterium]